MTTFNLELRIDSEDFPVQMACAVDVHNVGRSAKLIARAERLLKICSPFGRDNKLSSCPARQDIILAPISQQICVLK